MPPQASQKRAAPALKLPREPSRLGGLFISLVCHAAVLGAALWLGERVAVRDAEPVLAATPGARAGGGGGRSHVAYIVVSAAGRPRAAEKRAVLPAKQRVPPRTRKPRPPLVTPAVAPVLPPRVDTATAVFPPAPSPAESTAVEVAVGSGEGAGRAAGVGVGSGSGAGAGAGAGSGAGSAVGSGLGAGEAGRIIPPEMRAFSLPYERPPKELRGRDVEVTFWVSAAGRVERVRVRPEISDGGYRKKFLEVVNAIKFRPAHAPSGAPVAATFMGTFTLPTQ